MRTKTVLILTLFISATISFRCSKSRDRISGPAGDENLLINSSFEINGDPSLSGWAVSDTSRVHFSNDVPPDGGSWSISISPGWAPIFYSVTTTVAPPVGTHRYKLSFWTKSPQEWGSARLFLKRPDTLMVSCSLSFSDSSWATHSLLDTLSITSGDSLVVMLTGSWPEIGMGRTHFDLVRLEKLH